MKINKFNESISDDDLIKDIFEVIDRLYDFTDNDVLSINLGVFKYNKDDVGYTDDIFILTHRFIKDPNFYNDMFSRKIKSGYKPCILLNFKIKKDLYNISKGIDSDWSSMSRYLEIINTLKIFDKDWDINISHGSKHHQYQPLSILLIKKNNNK